MNATAILAAPGPNGARPTSGSGTPRRDEHDFRASLEREAQRLDERPKASETPGREPDQTRTERDARDANECTKDGPPESKKADERRRDELSVDEGTQEVRTDEDKSSDPADAVAAVPGLPPDAAPLRVIVRNGFAPKPGGAETSPVVRADGFDGKPDGKHAESVSGKTVSASATTAETQQADRRDVNGKRPLGTPPDRLVSPDIQRHDATTAADVRKGASETSPVGTDTGEKARAVLQAVRDVGVGEKGDTNIPPPNVTDGQDPARLFSTENPYQTVAAAGRIASSGNAPNAAADVVSQVREPIVQALRLGQNHVRVRLEPEGLGQIRIDLQVAGDRVHVRFHTENLMVRQIFETGMPELRARFDQNGLTLGDGSVEHRDSGHQGGRSPWGEHRQGFGQQGRHRRSFNQYIA